VTVVGQETAPQWGPRRYAADRELEARRLGQQRRYPHWGPVSWPTTRPKNLPPLRTVPIGELDWRTIEE